MESSVVLFKQRIHLFACTRPSVSSSLDCNDWLAFSRQSPACLSNTFLMVVIVCVQESENASVKSLLFKHVVPCCIQASFSTLCFKHIWIVIPCLNSRISLQPCVSNTFGLRLLVCLPSRPHQTRQKHHRCWRQMFPLQ